MDDYHHALVTRGNIESASLSPEALSRLTIVEQGEYLDQVTIVGFLDDAFRRLTAETDSLDLSSAWWYRRIPRRISAHLREELSSLGFDLSHCDADVLERPTD